MSDKINPKIIDASPTKDFFISMLVKDIGLIRAILDLVDNCVDGARRSRKNGDYSDLTVRIEATRDHFKIVDNCGGIPVDLARNYAFRFGRPEEMPKTPHSVGQFGVGMKRALFKLGSKFRIESTTIASRFVIEEDVDDWKSKKEWQFEFKELDDELRKVQRDDRGTNITVTNLHKSVSEDFELENFQTRLKDELETAHLDSMEKGLAITLNQIPLQFRSIELLHSGQLRAAYKEMVFEEKNRPPMAVKIYAGISKSDHRSTAGWYVFCNGRLVLEADQTLTTGWGQGGETTIPKYHGQFAMFRGYVLFDSDDAGRLPWNTTKTGVDADSSSFRAVRLEMINLMRPVIDFLNKLKEEKESEADSKPLEEAVQNAVMAKVSVVKTSKVFTAPKPKTRRVESNLGRIQYNKPLEEIEQVKKCLNVSTLREVGEKTFDYFLQMECEER